MTSTKLHGIIIIAGFKVRTDGLTIGDGFFYISSKDTGQLFVNYLNQKYRATRKYCKTGDRFGFSLQEDTASITIYCPDMEPEKFKEVQAFCNLFISHDSKGNRIDPIGGILKAENGKEVVKLHARHIDYINRPKPRSRMHYRYLEKNNINP